MQTLYERVHHYLYKYLHLLKKLNYLTPQRYLGYAGLKEEVTESNKKLFI